MKVRFNLDVNSWISQVDIEDVSSVDEAKEVLSEMTLHELINKGYIEDFSINQADAEVLTKSIKVHVTSVDYDVDEEDLADLGYDETSTAEEVEADLPQELFLEIEDIEDGYEDEAIADAISDKTGWLVNNFEYEITEVF